MTSGGVSRAATTTIASRTYRRALRIWVKGTSPDHDRKNTTSGVSNAIPKASESIKTNEM